MQFYKPMVQKGGVRAGILSVPIRIPDRSNVFQTETMAMIKAANKLNEHEFNTRRITIPTESQPVLLALNSAIVSSKL